MDYDSRQKGIVEEASAFAAREIRPRAAEFDAKGIFPRSLILKLAEEKFLSAPFPSEFGGLGLDPVYYGRMIEEIGKACSSARTLITVHTSLVGETLLRFGTPEQKNTWLPRMASGEKIGAFALSEPEVGSDAKNIRTSYEKKGGISMESIIENLINGILVRKQKNLKEISFPPFIRKIVNNCPNKISFFTNSFYKNYLPILWW